MENKTAGQIYGLIGRAIGMIGAIGKDKKNAQQGFMYRGIDQVYNALNPVMSELGIFFTPEILEQRREERTTKSGTVLYYTVLTVRFTAYAPDGSNVSMTVIGEGMDSGDKSSNKAMSVAMKYAMFQLFCIPTEEMKDPDAEVHTGILPKENPEKKPEPAKKQEPEAKPDPVRQFLTEKTAELRKIRGVSASENSEIFAAQFAELKAAGTVPDKRLGEYTMEEAQTLIDAMMDMSR